MKKTKTKIIPVIRDKLYTQLARRGDPSAFYALFGDLIGDLYIKMRSQGKDHAAACGVAEKTVSRMYWRYVRRAPVSPQRWFAAGCGLKKFNAKAANISVSTVGMADYERHINAALNRSYSIRLSHGSDGRGNLMIYRGPLPYIIGTAAAIFLIGFFFFSGTVFSLSFGRFGQEYKISFPDMAEGLWNMSGLVRDTSATSSERESEPDVAEPISGR